MTESTPLPQYKPIRAVAELIAGVWGGQPVPPRSGLAVCGATRCGYGFEWPIDRDTSAYCGRARCGLAHCGRRIRNNGLFAGLIPPMLSHRITLALTEQQGGPADPRPLFSTAYDNPSFTLHILGDDLVLMDATAHAIRMALDRTAHHETSWGTINTMSVGPAVRKVRTVRPQYDLTMTIDTETERPWPI